MKKATLIIWLIIFGFIALVIFQNQTFFMEKHSLRLNLGVIQEYTTPELPIAVVFVFFFVAGLVIEYLFTVSTRFKAKRHTKKLNAAIASHKDEVSGLQRELDTLKSTEAQEPGPAAVAATASGETEKTAGNGGSVGKSAFDKEGTDKTKNPTDQLKK